MRSDAWQLVARPLAFCIAIVFAAPSGSVLSNAERPPAPYHQKDSQKAAYVPGQLIVKLKGSPISEVIERHGLRVQERLPVGPRREATFSTTSAQESSYVLTAGPRDDMEALAASLSLEEGVKYAEPMYIWQAQAKPNDPLYAGSPAWWDNQWNLTRIGMEDVWPESSEGEVVKVNLDSGVDLDHPDIIKNVWQNWDEIPENNVDDDGNGYIDDRFGWDFVNSQPLSRDLHGHGTTTFLDATGNNGTGVAGLNLRGKVMNLAVIDVNGVVTGNVIKAMDYAKVTLARYGKTGVFNASYGGLGRSQAVLDAIESAQMLFVASTGNSGNSNPTGIHYPAAFNAESQWVISVTASDLNDRVMSGASLGMGNTRADIAAPGSALVTKQGGGYGFVGGTSVSAAHVSSALVLLMSRVEPDAQRAKMRLFKSVDIMSEFTGKVKTNGRLNVARAFHGQFNPNRVPVLTLSSGHHTVGEQAPLALTASASDPDGDPLTVSWQFSDGRTFTGSAIAPVFPLGSYWATVTVSDGIASATLTITIQVTDRVEVRPKVKGVKKLVINVTSSRQSQSPRPSMTIRELNQEVPYDEGFQAYRVVLNIKKNSIPSPLTIESELGGTFTLWWR